MKAKIWHFLCLVFCVFNLILLFEDSNSTSYKYLDESEINYPFNYSICIPINDLNKHIRDTVFNVNLTVNKFVNSTGLLERIINNLNLKENFKLNKIIKKESFISQNHLCFSLGKNLEKVFLEFKKSNYKLLIVSKYSKLFYINLVFSNEHSNLRIKKLKLFKSVIKNFNSKFVNCSNEKNYSKFKCLYDCLKEKDKKSIYFYEFEVPEFFNLTNEEINKTDKLRCYKKCKQESCNLEYFLSNTLVYISKEEEKDPDTIENNLYLELYYSMGNLDFCLQFIGLIVLFFNLSISENVSGILNLLISKAAFYQRFKLRKYYPKAKFLISTICLFFFVQICYYKIDEYRQYFKEPQISAISTYSNKTEKLSIILCIPVQIILRRKKIVRIGKLGLKVDNEMLNNYTFNQLENLTKSSLNEFLVKSFLTYGGKEKDIELKRSEKVYFKKCAFYETKLTGDYFSICSRLEFYLKEKRYESLLTITKLVLKKDEKFSNFVFKIYIIKQEKPFLSDSFEYTRNFQISKSKFRKIESSTKSNCRNYNQKSHLNCKTRRECTDKCIREQYFKKHLKLTTIVVIDKDELESYLLPNLHFSNEEDRNISDSCEKLYAKQDCEITYFNESYKQNPKSEEDIVINLYNETFAVKEVEPNFGNLLLSILNLESVLFGSNVTKLLLLFFSVLKVIFKIKWYSWFRHLVFIICLSGFIFHFFTIFTSIIQGSLSETSYHVKTDRLEWPELVFCLKIDERL